jgi:O-antigen/teichoic acid export membrane protein
MSAVTSRKGILANAAASAAGFTAQMAVAFFLCPVLVHGLGDRRYGMWSLVESVLAYLSLFDLGVAAAVIRYGARLCALKDRDHLNRVFSTSLCIFTAAGLAALAVALACAGPGVGLVGVPEDLADETRWMFVLLGVNLAVGLPLQVFPALLDALGRFPSKTAVRTAAALVRVPLFLGVLGAGGGLVALAWAITLTNVAEHAALAVLVRRHLPWLRFSPALADRATFREIRGYSLDASLAMLAGRISFQTDAVVISLFLAPQYITFFAVAGRLVEYSKGLVRSATTVLTPAVSTLEARGDFAAIRRMLFHSTRLVLWITLPIQAGLVLLGRPFLALWLQGDYHAERSYATLVILSLTLALTMSQSVSGRILYGIGRLRWYSRAVLVEGVANLLLSVALVGPLGIEGVAWGTTVPHTCFNVLLLLYVCRSLRVWPAAYLRRSFVAPVGAAGLLAGFWLLSVRLVPPDTWPLLLATGAAGVAVYAFLAAVAEVGPRRLWQEGNRLVARLGRGAVGSGEPPALCRRDGRRGQAPPLATPGRQPPIVNRPEAACRERDAAAVGGPEVTLEARG